MKTPKITPNSKITVKNLSKFLTSKRISHKVKMSQFSSVEDDDIKITKRVSIGVNPFNGETYVTYVENPNSSIWFSPSYRKMDKIDRVEFWLKKFLKEEQKKFKKIQLA